MAIFGRSKKKDEGEADVKSNVVPPPGQAESGQDAKAEPSAKSVIENASAGNYRKVRVKPGGRGWGKGLVIAPKPGRDLIYSVTGGGIHPVAQRIADLTGGRTFDGFKSKAKFEEIACAVIDCGGTARIGVYPMKGVLTVDVHGASPSGPLMRFINEENFVSGVSVTDIEVVE
jgi:glucitol/sorbitol PTS system EIIB component